MKRLLAILLTLSILLCFTACEQKPVESNAEDSLSQLSSVVTESDALDSVVTEVAASDGSEAISNETSQPEQSVLSSDDVVGESTAVSVPLVSDSNENSVVSYIGGINADPEDVTSEVMQNALEEYHAFIDSLQAEKIGKIMIDIGSPGTSQSQETTDSEMIGRWLAMFRSIKIKCVRPYTMNYGASSSYIIYDREGNIYESFTLANGVLNMDFVLTQLVIEEMDEELLQSLMEEMGLKSELPNGDLSLYW